MWRTIELTFIDVFAGHDRADAELWLHPADWEAIGRPAGYAGMPVRTSPGIPAGTARIFDRVSLRYLPAAGKR
jgi:hypothetical protein